MNRSLRLIVFLGILLFVGTGQSAVSQVSLPHYEGFEYSIGSALQTQGGWTANNSGDDILVADGSLSYPNYITSKGNRIKFGGVGIDAYKSITPESSGTLYYSFILKVTDVSAATNTDGGYFAGFGQSPTIFGATIWLKKDASNFRIGINPRTTASATVFSTETFTVNSEILIVAAYQMNSATGDDVVSLWINPPESSFGNTTLPTASLSATNTGGSDLSSISSVFIRQDSDGETPLIEMDELRISKTWQDVVPLVAATDLAPPVFTSDFPKLVNINTTQADLQVNMDEAGKAYYVVVPDGSTAPTVAEVVAGTSYGTVTLTAHGTIDVTAGGGTYSATITGLTDKTNYDVYVVAEDDETTPNRQSAAVKVDLYTTRPPDLLLNGDFETANSLAPFTQVSITGDQTWSQTGGYAKISGYVSSTYNANLDYLISPAINLAASETNMLSFRTMMNFDGPALKVMLSTNFSGTYTAAEVSAATWTDITANFSLSTGNWLSVNSGEFSLSAYSGNVYVAFVFESTAVASATWEVDDVRITGYLLPGHDASLSDLKVEGTTVTSFDAATLSYEIILEASVTTPPAIIPTTTDPSATVVVTNATDLTGSAAERTTSVVVTAADGTTKQTYTILFNPIIAVTDLAALRAVSPDSYGRIYQVTGQVVVSGTNDAQRHQKYVQDASAGIIIDDADGKITTAYNVGDGITGLTGSLSEYSKLLQLIPYRNPGTASSTGNALTPQVVTVTEFNSNQENYESELVKIVGVKFTDANGTTAFQEKKNYNISVGADVTILRTIFLGTDLTGKVIPYMADVTGIATVYNTDAQLTPRNYADFTVYSSDAALSDLKVSGTTVTGFAAGTLTYNVSLPAGTTAVPAVTATPAEANAAVVITPATSLTGDATARTAKIDVTSQDKSTIKNYTIVFSVATAIEDNLTGKLRLYPIPARDEITAEGISGVALIEIFEVTGNKVITIRCEGDSTSAIPLSGLARGLYFMKLTSPQGVILKKFVKE